MPVEFDKKPRRPGLPPNEEPVMRIHCVQTVNASPNGIDVYKYVEHETYDADTVPPMSASLAETFLREGWGVKAPDPEFEVDEDEEKDDSPVDASTHELTVPEVREYIAEEESVEFLQALRRGEQENPKGERVGVLEAIDERLKEIYAQSQE